MRSVAYYTCAAWIFVAVALPQYARAQAAVTFSNTSEIDLGASGDPRPQAIAVQDVNGDGLGDILAVNGDTGEINVFLNSGACMFSGDTIGPDQTVSGPLAIAAGDFNGDGLTDILTVNRDSPRITVFLADPQSPDDFSGVEAVESDVPAVPTGVIVEHLDGDGTLDLAVLSDNAIYPLKGDGHGSFSAFNPDNISTGGAGGFAIASGLLNNDRFVDLVTSNSGTNNLSVLLGNGDGTFQAATLLPVGAQPQGLLIGKLNSDGNLDLAVVNAAESAGVNISILFGHGDGTFDADTRTGSAELPFSLAGGDFGADGRLDLAVSTNSVDSPVIILRNDTTTPGNFTPQIPTLDVALAQGQLAIQAGQLDIDSRPDLAVLGVDGLIHVLCNTTGTGPAATLTPTGTLLPTSTATPPPPTATPTPTATFTNTATATPTAIPTAPYSVCNSNDPGQPQVGGRPVAVALGDFDRDPDESLDIAVADNTGKVVVLLTHQNQTAGDACGVLGLQRDAEVINVAAPVALVASDLDDDGKLDLAVVGSGGLSVFFGNGSGGFVGVDANPMAAGTAPRSLSVGDFNRDGVPDIIVGNEDSNDVSLFLGAGGRAFQPQCRYGVGGKASVVVTEFLDADRQLDFAVASDQTNQVSVFLQTAATPTGGSTGCPTFQALSPLRLPGQQQPVGLVVGRFDQSDTLPDFGVATTSSTANGQGLTVLGMPDAAVGVRYQTKSQLEVPGLNHTSMPSAIGAGDINRDGNAELIIADKANNDVVIFEGNADGSLKAPWQPFQVRGAGPRGLAVGDIDGDGRPDVVTANADDGSISVLVSSRPPATPTAVPTFTPTVTGTPTMTPTSPGTGTPTGTLTPTPSPTSTRTPLGTQTFTQTPTDTPRGKIVLNGSCALDPAAAGDGIGLLLLPWIPAGILARRSRGTRRFGRRRRTLEGCEK